ncbi:OsmC family protein [Brevibacillus laterosporus]
MICLYLKLYILFAFKSNHEEHSPSWLLYFLNRRKDHAIHSDQTLQTTLPFENLTISSDRQSGFKPIDLLVSAIAGCSQIVFTRILEKQRISYDSLTLQNIYNQSKNHDCFTRTDRTLTIVHSGKLSWFFSITLHYFSCHISCIAFAFASSHGVTLASP